MKMDKQLFFPIHSYVLLLKCVFKSSTFNLDKVLIFARISYFAFTTPLHFHVNSSMKYIEA